MARIGIAISAMLLSIVLFTPITYGPMMKPLLLSFLPLTISSRWQYIYLASETVLFCLLLLTWNKNILMQKTISTLLRIIGFITIPYGFFTLSSSYIITYPLQTNPKQTVRQSIILALLFTLAFTSYEYIRVTSDTKRLDDRMYTLLQNIEDSRIRDSLTITDLKKILVMQENCVGVAGTTTNANIDTLTHNYKCLSTQLTKNGYTIEQFNAIGDTAQKLNSK